MEEEFTVEQAAFIAENVTKYLEIYNETQKVSDFQEAYYESDRLRKFIGTELKRLKNTK